MLIKQVAKLPPRERFLYWITERHRIFLKRERGELKPWTDDEVLQSFFFTNPYRENDKVTRWFRESIREPLRNDPRVLMATVIFRWFNLPETADRIIDCLDSYRYGRLERWDSDHVIRVLDRERKAGRKIFTGAYMINSSAGEPKLEAICRRIDNVWKDRGRLLPLCMGDLEAAHYALTQFDGLGGFMAYEVVTDLRHTYLLENAPDIMTWCNPGPGCVRGLCRLLDIDFPKGRNAHGFTPKVQIDKLAEMRKLLAWAQERIDRFSDAADFPRLEMREIEHSLCEWDKYERARLGDGKMKRRYNGTR